MSLISIYELLDASIALEYFDLQSEDITPLCLLNFFNLLSKVIIF